MFRSTCKHCNKEFKANYKDKKYCNQKCMGLSYRKSVVCVCGCNEIISDTTGKNPRKYKDGHYKKPSIPQPKGKDSKLYKGGWVASNGYRYINQHAKGKTKTVPLHRKIMEEHLGRKLKSHEHIDHINGNKLDNRIENLRITTPRQNCHYYWGITEKDIRTVIKRLKDGVSYRKCIEDTNIKSIATVKRIRERHGLA